MKKVRLKAGFVLLALLGVASEGRAAITCTTEDYNGSYAFYTTGALLQLPPEAALLLGTFAQSGTFTSDGQGNVTIESTASYNGLIQNANSVATYTITPECRMVFNLTLPFPLSVPSTFSGVLSRVNREMTLIISDPPGTLVVGHHYKQDLRFCGVNEFRGAYALDIEGTVATPASRAGRFHRSGRLVADGAGNFTASTLANYAGRLVKEDFSGTYDVNGKCNLSLRYTQGTENITLQGPFGGHGDIAVLMITSPGWAVSGTLKAQQ